MRVCGGTYASGNGLGFALGGYQTAATDPAYKTINDQFYVPGMVMHNFTSEAWYNISMEPQYTTLSDGAAHFVPTFGHTGLLLLLGGDVGHVQKNVVYAKM